MFAYTTFNDADDLAQFIEDTLTITVYNISYDSKNLVWHLIYST